MSVLRSAFLISVFSLVAYADSDCRISYKFSNRSGDSALFGQQPVISPPNTSPQYDNRLAGCTGWALNYDNEGFSALSIQLEDAPTSSTSGTAGSFVAFAGTGVSGSNPATNTTSGSYTATGYYPYLRVNVSSVTGTGSINVTLNGWKSPNYIATLGGGLKITSGTSVSLVSGTAQMFTCTSTCTIIVPPPAQGAQYCIYNDDNVATVITLAAIGSSSMYENTARTTYGTAGTGTAVSSGVVGDSICIVFRDSTHYSTLTFTGAWTIS